MLSTRPHDERVPPSGSLPPLERPATGEESPTSPGLSRDYPASRRETEGREVGERKGNLTPGGVDLPRAESHNGDRKGGPETPVPDAEDHHHASLSMDSILMAEKEALRRCSVATVVKMTKSLGGCEKVTAATAGLFEPGLKWASELYGDGRILIHCPSEVIARELERQREITFPDFVVRFEPWSFDVDPSEMTNEEIRWVAGEGLPTFGRNIDTIARVLKPIGELIHLAVHSPRLIGHFRAMVRIRRGRRFPANIHSTILRRKYLVRVVLEPGQAPLPWTPVPERIGAAVEQAAEDDRRRKGKLPIGPEVCDRQSPKNGEGLEEYGEGLKHANCSGAVRSVRRRFDAGGEGVRLSNKLEHVASDGVVDQQSSQNIGSCNVEAGQPNKARVNNTSTSIEEVNENQTQAITIYSKSKNLVQKEDDDDSDEVYLDPIIERQIELEFEALWNSQLEGEESNHSGGPNKEHKDEEQNGNNLTSPSTDPPIIQPGANIMALLGPTTQNPLQGHDDDSKSSYHLDNPIPDARPNSPLHSPTRNMNQGITIPGPHPDIDISNYSWRLV
ncbi:hypothetical protein J5N97_013856 [Dioscorea zingiberensis]|uniref:Uncharacterized protein n=1 Tax=Dioscorea zingiberensis TaxID=325984 RepID=A0A9D5CSW5_9LILI|nr:hypothetical protein J5N97_013856 [Dioscorea zingiberensis]